MSNRGRHKKSNKHLIVQILGQSIANRMMQCQKEQRNPTNLDVFLYTPDAGAIRKGFVWRDTSEGHYFWENQITILQNHPLYKKWKNDRR